MRREISNFFSNDKANAPFFLILLLLHPLFKVFSLFLHPMALHNEIGRIGEMVAARHLIQHGYSLLHTDYRVGHKDIDIVAFKDGITVFVEVKTRSTDRFGSPEEAVDDEKMRFLLSAANAYIKREGVMGPVRFDVIAVVGTAEPFSITHFTNVIDTLRIRN